MNPTTSINYNTSIGNLCLTTTNTNGNNINNNNSSIGLTIDHQQLLQISQLMNEMQNNSSSSNNTNTTNQTEHMNHQQQECITLDDTNLGQSQTNSLNNLMEIVVTSPRSATQGSMISLSNNTNNLHMNSNNNNNQSNSSQQNNTYYSNSLVLSPNSLSKYESQGLQYSTSVPTQALVNSQQIFAIAQPQQQQEQIIDANSLQQQQVHTIMLNGQPALFIPASSAMSSNLLCQMLMNQNSNQSTSSTSNASVPSSTSVVLSATNSNDLFANNQFESASNSKQDVNKINGNSMNSDTYLIGTQQQQHSFINLSQLGLTTAIPLDQNQSVAHSQSTASNQQASAATLSNGMTIIQIPNANNEELNVQLNSNVNIVQAQQPQLVCKLENIDTSNLLNVNSGNQILCIQPDGNITFQTVQAFNAQQTSSIQLNNQIQQQENLDFNSSVSSFSTTNKSKRTKLDPKVSAKPAKSKKVASLLNGNTAKLIQTQAANIIDASTLNNHSTQTIQLQMNEQNQWVLVNSPNSLTNIITSTSSTANNIPLESQNQNQSDNNDDASQLNSSFTERLIDVNGQKRKRKACDCPNCIRWRQNAMTKEEMSKKRTHKCHKCPKEYNKTSHLRAHLRAHDNYRPYVCDFKTCGKSFTRSDELKRHKRIHNDDRNFPCSICKKKFLRSDHLNKHLLVHNKSNLTTKSKLIQQQLEDEQLQQQQQKPSQQPENQLGNDANFKIEYINFSADQDNTQHETRQLAHSNQHLVKLVNDQSFPTSAVTTSSLPSSNTSSVDSSPNLLV